MNGTNASPAHDSLADDSRTPPAGARAGDAADPLAPPPAVLLPDELRALDAAFDAVEREARALVSDLSEAEGAWRPAPGAWSVAECFDHLATANRVYLDAMQAPAERAHASGRRRRGPALPGAFGRWFAGVLEPPATKKTKAPRKIVPRTAPPLADAFAQFLASHAAVRGFLRAHAGIDLAGVHFPNPFVPLLRFSLASGLHILAAHERRHVWQAGQVRAAARSGQAAPR